jgi:TPR repeat protein
MDKPWFRKLFDRPQERPLETVQAKADDGDADAQFSLGMKYASSEGATHDYVQAVEWYLKAAAQSHALAQFNLGVMYARGQGVLRDDAKALMWIRRAAQQGDAGAQFNLGTRQHRASVAGPPKDAPESKMEAYKWFHLAAAQGYKGSETAFQSVALGMTRDEVADAGHRAAAFVAVSLNHPQV